METKEAYPYNDESSMTLSERDELMSCLNKQYISSGPLGLILGGVITKVSIDKLYPKMPRILVLSSIYGGALTGLILAKSIAVRNCLTNIRMQRGSEEMMPSKMDMYEKKYSQNNRKISSAEVPSTVQNKSIFEMESMPEMSAFGDSSTTNENANLDIPEQQIPVKPRKTTYEELRQKNKEMLEDNRISQRQAREGWNATESNIPSSLGTGTKRTKYGDVWD